MISPDTASDGQMTNPDPPFPQPQVQTAADDRERLKRRGGHSVSVKGLNAYYGASRTIKDMTIKFPAQRGHARSSVRRARVSRPWSAASTACTRRSPARAPRARSSWTAPTSTTVAST